MRGGPPFIQFPCDSHHILSSSCSGSKKWHEPHRYARHALPRTELTCKSRNAGLEEAALPPRRSGGIVPCKLDVTVTVHDRHVQSAQRPGPCFLKLNTLTRLSVGGGAKPMDPIQQRCLIKKRQWFIESNATLPCRLGATGRSASILAGTVSAV